MTRPTPAPSSRSKLPEKTPPMPAIGAHIRQRRKALGMTLSQLSAHSGLSAPFLSQLERNLASPSLVSLMSLTRALDLEIESLLKVPSERNIICRAKKRQLILTGSKAKYYDLSADLPMRQMDAILMRIPPGHVYPVDQRNGEEFLFILEGELEVEVGDVKTTLSTGDSLHFNSQLPHKSQNRTRKTVSVLYVGTPSVLPSDPRPD